MADTKRLAIWLAKCVYHYSMSDDDIVQTSGPRFCDRAKQEDVQWLREQIKTVRAKPEIFKRML